MGHLTDGTDQPVNDRMLTLDRLRHLIAEGDVDTVVMAFTDMQGRLQGKRLHAQYFLDRGSSTAPRAATTCSPSTST